MVLLRQSSMAVALVAASMLVVSCGGEPDRGQAPGATPRADTVGAAPLAADEVEAILQSAARALPDAMAIAVVDRRGVVLGAATNFGFDADDFETDCVDAVACPAFDIDETSDCAVAERAVQLARTAAFFSADQTPLTSRSVRFLSGEHFPPGVRNAAAAALFGIENTNRGCAFDAASRPAEDRIPRARSLAATFDPTLRCDSADDSGGARCGCSRGIATLPGGVPIFKNGRMVGGVGVALRDAPIVPDAVAAFDAPEVILRSNAADVAFERAELAARAFAGDDVGFPTLRRLGLTSLCDGPDAPTCCFPEDPEETPCTFGILPAAPPLPFDPVIFVDGIEIPEVASAPQASGLGTGIPVESYIVAPLDDAAASAPSRWLVPERAPLPADPPESVVDVVADCSACPINPDPGCGDDAARLCPQDVCAIMAEACREARRIRGAIRLPLEARTAMVLAVSDRDGELVGLFRMDDATVFSIDVAVAKSRNVVYFSSPTIEPVDRRDCDGPTEASCTGEAFPPGTAITNRTLSFGAQPFFPSGIDGTRPGPFRRVFVEDSAMPCTNGREPANGRQNGIVFFPGSVPLYKNGVLVGGFGVSGDGVEQDDIVSLAGAEAGPGFTPAAGIRADQIFVRGVRLPYLKFNRRPEQ